MQPTADGQYFGSINFDYTIRSGNTNDVDVLGITRSLMRSPSKLSVYYYHPTPYYYFDCSKRLKFLCFRRSEFACGKVLTFRPSS